jgi:hypothetical protein
MNEGISSITEFYTTLNQFNQKVFISTMFEIDGAPFTVGQGNRLNPLGLGSHLFPTFRN